jgi:hypothetical protein
MICSTVSPPTMDRRWPAKMRPTRSSMRLCSARNRRAALAIEAVSSPTLNADVEADPVIRPAVLDDLGFLQRQGEHARLLLDR